MRLSARALLIGMVLGVGEPIFAEEGVWQPSTLSDKTLEKVHEGLRSYERCVNDETRTHVDDQMDSRKVADTILRNCENQLSGVKAAFDSEKVPESISERYLRSKRSLAAQQILRVVMAIQAVRSSGGIR